MRTVAFAPAAVTDLEDIGDYIAIDNKAAATRFIGNLRTRCSALRDAPHGGRARPEIREGLRSIPYRRYVIFYTIEASGIRIERILHGARDIDQAFDPENDRA